MNTKHRILSVMLILAMVATLCIVAAAPASADVSSVTARVTTTPAVAGDNTDVFNVSFITTQPLGTNTVAGGAVNGLITVTFPSGTAAAIIGTETITGSVAGLIANGAGAGQAVWAAASNTIIITVNAPAAVGAPIIAAGETVTIATVAGTITHPVWPVAAGGSGNPRAIGSQTVSVRTNVEPVNVTSSPYSIMGIMLSGDNRTAAGLPNGTAATGATITVTGFGYTPGQSVDVYRMLGLAGQAVIASSTVEADGSFTATFTMNAGSVGPIGALDGAGVGSAGGVAPAPAGGAYNVLALAGAPSLALSATTGLPSAQIQVTGTGFPGAAAIAAGGVTFGGVALVAQASQVALTAAGPGNYWVQETIALGTAGRCIVQILPPANLSAGVKTISITDNTVPAKVATATYTVPARTITVSPSSGPAGTTVTITGTGFAAFAPATGGPPAGAGISATTNTGATAFPSPTFATNSEGGFVKTVTIPSSYLPGTVGITCTDSWGNAASSGFVIPAAAPAAISTLSPDSGAVGTSVAATVSGFRALSTVTAQFTTPLPVQTTIVASGTTDSAGGCVLHFVVPASAPGFATVTVTDEGGTARTKTFTVTATAAVVSVSDGLSSIAGQYEYVWRYDAASQSWQLYDPAAGTDEIGALTVGQALWIKATQATTITYGVHSIPLVEGWNNIGWQG